MTPLLKLCGILLALELAFLAWLCTPSHAFQTVRLTREQYRLMERFYPGTCVLDYGKQSFSSKSLSRSTRVTGNDGSPRNPRGSGSGTGSSGGGPPSSGGSGTGGKGPSGGTG